MAPPKKRKQAAPAVGVASVQRSNKPLIIGIGVVIAIIALVAVIIGLTGSSSDEAGGPPPAEWQAVNVSGAALGSLPSSGADPAVGQPAPQLRGESFTGTPVNIVNDGKAKAVMFFAHWCPHCRREAPVLADWIKANENKYDVDFYAVATGTRATDANYPPSDWFKEMSFPTPVLVDDRAAPAAQAYGLSSYPYLVFIGKDGNVVSRTSGEIGADKFGEFVAAAAGTSAPPATTANNGADTSPSS